MMDMTFSELIRAYRQREGLTLAEMGRRCGTTAQYLHSVESGVDTSVSRADAILSRIGLSLTLGKGPSIETRRKKRESA